MREQFIPLEGAYTGAQILKALLALEGPEFTTALLNYESGVRIKSRSWYRRTRWLRFCRWMDYVVSLAGSRMVSGALAPPGPLAFETAPLSGQFEPCRPWKYLRALTFTELQVWFFEHGGDGWEKRVDGFFPESLRQTLIKNLRGA